MDKIDEVDIAILKLLIGDAKLPYTEVGKLLNVSSGTVHVRMRKLEQAGVVTGATLSINHENLGFKISAFLGIDLVRDEMHDEVILKLRGIRQVLAAYYTSGPHPILVKIICHNTAELTDILKSQICPIAGVRSVEVYLTLAEYFNRSVDISFNGS